MIARLTYALAAMCVMSTLASPAHAQTETITRTYAGPGGFSSGASGIGSKVALPDTRGVVTDVNVVVHQKTFEAPQRYEYKLTHAGRTIDLSVFRCLTHAGSVTFDDSATRAASSAVKDNSCGSGNVSVKPMMPLSTFNGLNVTGDWSLGIVGSSNGSINITSWDLVITFIPEQVVTYSWATTEWGEWTTTCGNAQRSRSPYCKGSDGKSYADSFCAGSPRPTSQDAQQILTGCTYEWSPSAWVDAPSCGDTMHSRTATCKRSDGAVVDDAQCGSLAAPVLEEVSPNQNYEMCTYEWSVGAWNDPGPLCGSGTRTRTVLCGRSDGVDYPAAQCGDKPKPSPTETVQGYDACAIGWVQTGFRVSECSGKQQTYTPYWTCKQGPNALSPTFCAGQPAPAGSRIQACGYWDANPDDLYTNMPGGSSGGGSGGGGGGGGGGSSGGGYGSGGGVYVGGSGSSPSSDSATGGSYNPEDNTYVTPEGVYQGGYYDWGTNTYYDGVLVRPPSKGGVVIFRKKVPSLTR